jgi:hypothetical protein
MRLRKTKIIKVSICVLLFLGIIIVCIIGESRMDKLKYKKYSGAKQVINRINDTWGHH